jgi:hypothetical protein
MPWLDAGEVGYFVSDRGGGMRHSSAVAMGYVETAHIPRSADPWWDYQGFVPNT